MASLNATSEMSASSRIRGGAPRMTDNRRAVSYEANAAYAAPAEPDDGTVDARGAQAILSGRGLY
jgi:rare lipoprotein A